MIAYTGIRLYVVVRDHSNGREVSEGPYCFDTPEDAFAWMRKPRPFNTIVSATLLDDDGVIARAPEPDEETHD